MTNSSKLTIHYDGTLDIATGRSRKDIHWRNQPTLWSDFVRRVSTTHRTAETISEYNTAAKTRQDEIKDIGGFVGGFINGGRRKSEAIRHRQLITLDLDFAKPGFWEDFCMLYTYASAIYSTHKHTPAHPRLRLIIPIDRPVNPDEYVALSRKIAGVMGIEFFDDTTFEPARLMYWPSTSKDGIYEFDYQDAPWLCADEQLGEYKDWRDASQWPVSTREGAVIRKEITKQGDPLEKPGLIGAFCREYDIHEAIESFLPEVYTTCDVEGRYTYLQGSTAGGLVTYNDKFAFSHHGTDPARGRLCNAFDLVRIHLFGVQDEDAREGTAHNRLPSFLAMQDFARKDSRVAKRLVTERTSESLADFAEPDDSPDVQEANEDWKGKLDTDRKGNVRRTIDNMKLVLDNDPRMAKHFAHNSFENRDVITASLPWRRYTPDTKYMTDKDDAGIRHFLEKGYDLTGTEKIADAIALVLQQNAYHPVREYLATLTWDGTERLDTLLVDYLGASDNEYTRAVTRKTFTAAVARVHNPGCKFDFVLVLIGPQGKGKSTLVKKMGRDWYSDSFMGVQGKESFEQLQGVWIMELAELANLKRAEIESVKHFISKAEDRYRVAYGKRTDNFPRQCIFIGTDNNKDFLRDPTGNRRFWPVDICEHPTTHDVWDELGDEVVDQLWAEAVVRFKAGEALYLNKELEMKAQEIQRWHSEVDDRAGIIQKFLDTLLPSDWNYMDPLQRRSWYNNPDELQKEGSVERIRVSVAEIWCELFGKPHSEMTRFNTKEIHSIMRQMTGWEESKYPVDVKHYGRQRIYKRSEKGGNMVYTDSEKGGIQVYTKIGIAKDGSIHGIQE